MEIEVEPIRPEQMPPDMTYDGIAAFAHVASAYLDDDEDTSAIFAVCALLQGTPPLVLSWLLQEAAGAEPGRMEALVRRGVRAMNSLPPYAEMLEELKCRDAEWDDFENSLQSSTPASYWRRQDSPTDQNGGT